MNIKIILGSTRDGRFSDKLGAALKKIADEVQVVKVGLLDLKDYDLPFLSDSVPPIRRTVITDNAVKRWSEDIEQADAFIILVPEYNAGYPGVLKNALDLLYKEWNNKPVGFIGYSGGPDGGLAAIMQLRQVTNALKMTTISTTITIPASYKLLSDNYQDVILLPTLKEDFLRMLSEISAALKK